MSKCEEIKRCRICKSDKLVSILNLGSQALTGVFPKSGTENVQEAPLELVKCDVSGSEHCGLVQLRHNMPLDLLYGETYGYRSGLNPSMVAHLKNRVRKVLLKTQVNSGDLVIDIGSNDGSLLSAYLQQSEVQLDLLGIDPLSKKFAQYYPSEVKSIGDFFSADLVRTAYGDRKAKIVTSLSMFYDLEEPLEFMKQIRKILAQDGIWVFEQSYLPTMLEKNSYDTVCHEHLEYYALRQIQWMAERAGLKILDVEFNNVNGGSFAITAGCDNGPYAPEQAKISSILRDEQQAGLDTLQPYQEFSKRIHKTRDDLLKCLNEIRAKGKKVFGYGASTKGNVILQFCGITSREIPYILEVNSDKFGAFTPGTRIPIISEEEGRRMNPDYLLPLPWHFGSFFIEKEQKFIELGGKILFPLPQVEVLP